MTRSAPMSKPFAPAPAAGWQPAPPPGLAEHPPPWAWSWLGRNWADLVKIALLAGILFVTTVTAAVLCWSQYRAHQAVSRFEESMRRTNPMFKMREDDR